MGDGGQTQHQSEKLLLCQYFYSSSGYGTTGGGREKRSADDGTNSNIELVLMSVGKSGTTGVAGAFQIKTAIPKGYQKSRQRARGSFRGRAEMRGEHLKGAIIVTNPTLLRSNQLDVQPELRQVIFAERLVITRKLVGERGLTGGDLRWD